MFTDAGVVLQSTYANGLRAEEQGEREVELAKLRPSIYDLFEGILNVHNTRFPTADELFVQLLIRQQGEVYSKRA